MSSSMYVFTGENVFALEDAIRVWAAQFTAKHGVDNLLHMDAGNCTVRDFLDVVGVAPFLAAKRLVIVRGQMKFTKEEMGVVFASMHPDVVVVFAQPKFDQRFGAVKELLKQARVRTFSPLRRPQLLSWSMQFARQQGGTMFPDAAEQLLCVVGEDQQMLATEIRKLCLYAAGRAVTEGDIRALALPGEGSQWRLTDLLTEGRTREALLYAHDLAERGQDANATWNILLWLLRTIVLAAACAASGKTQQAHVARAAGVPPYRVQALLALQEKLGMPAVRALVREAVAMDVAFKTGGFRSSAENTEELESVIDRVILRFSVG